MQVKLEVLYFALMVHLKRMLHPVERVRLFVDRASSVQPQWQLTAQNAGAVAHICRQLDGIPLALELAAARTRVLSVQAIASRLVKEIVALGGDASKFVSPRVKDRLLAKLRP